MNATVDQVAEQIDSQLGQYTFIDSNERYLRSNIEFQTDFVVDYAAKRCDNGSTCEYGIFECVTERHGEQLSDQIEARIEKRLELADNRYFTDEIANLRNAKVEQNGRYVFYCILPLKDQKTALNIFEKAFE